MELWIRSQNKELLIKAKDLAVYKRHDGSTDIYSNDNLLGKYSTYERALEVLNEIQSKIQGSLNIETFKIYEMPED